MMVRVQLMDVASGDIVGSETIRVGPIFAGRKYIDSQVVGEELGRAVGL